MSETVELAVQIRGANLADAPFLIRANEACRYECEELTPAQVYENIQSGRMETYILETFMQSFDDPVSKMCVSVMQQGNCAVLGGLFREGRSEGLLFEARQLLDAVEGVLIERGVGFICAYIHRDNPRHDKLVKFYEALRFRHDATRMGRAI